MPLHPNAAAAPFRQRRRLPPAILATAACMQLPASRPCRSRIPQAPKQLVEIQRHPVRFSVRAHIASRIRSPHPIAANRSGFHCGFGQRQSVHAPVPGQLTRWALASWPMQASVSKLEARAAGLVRVFNRRLHGACYASGGNRMGSTFQYPALHIYVIAGERFSNQMLVARAPLGFSGRSGISACTSSAMRVSA